MQKLPPIEKVYEAWSAIADGRVAVEGDKATVTSSDGERQYAVAYDPATDTYASSDPATAWQGYAGYPVIAFMMVKGTLPFDYQYAQQWAGVNWNALNKAYKRDYAQAVDHVERERGIDHASASARAQAVMSTLAALPIRLQHLRSPNP